MTCECYTLVTGISVKKPDGTMVIVDTLPFRLGPGDVVQIGLVNDGSSAGTAITVV